MLNTLHIMLALQTTQPHVHVHVAVWFCLARVLSTRAKHKPVAQDTQTTCTGLPVACFLVLLNTPRIGLLSSLPFILVIVSYLCMSESLCVNENMHSVFCIWTNCQRPGLQFCYY